MERLTIDEIIEHCDRKTRMYEKACDVKYLETAVMGNRIKEYWEHRQVKEYLEELNKYRDYEEKGLLLRLPAPLNGVDSFSLNGKEIWQRIPCHCKDCSHWVDGCAGCTEHVKLCDVGHYMVGENGYCLYAEQKVRNNQ